MRSFNLRSSSFHFIFGVAALLCAIGGFSVSAQTGTIGTAASTLTISSNVTSGTQDITNIELSASVVAASGTTVPTGYVLFYTNGNPIFASALSKGMSSEGTLTLRAGTDVITATYIGDENFAAVNSSNSVTITIAGLPATFVFGTFSPANASVVQGKTANFSTSLTANQTFSGTVAITCSGAPAESSCAVTPNSAAFALVTSGYQPVPQTATISVLFSTTAPDSSNVAENRSVTLIKSAGGIGMAGLLLLVLPRRKGKRWNALTTFAVVGLGLCSMMTLTGCGNGSKSATVAGTATGTYPLTITATSGSVSQTATVMVSVTGS